MGTKAEKVPWLMTREEYHQYWRREFFNDRRRVTPTTYKDFDLDNTQLACIYRLHEREVKQAIAEGLSISPEVLKDYPELNH